MMNILKNFFKGKQAEKKTCSSCGTLDLFQGLSDIQRRIGMDQNQGAFWMSNDPWAKVLAVHICQERNAAKFIEIINRCYLRSRKGEKKKIESGDPVFDVLFGRPNDLEQDPYSFFHFMLLQYYQNGVAYAHAIGDPPNSILLSMEPLFSQNVSPIENLYDPMKPRITGYRINDIIRPDNDGSTADDAEGNVIPPERMLVVRKINPYDRINPISSYIPLYDEMDMMNSINKWQKKNYKGGVYPDVIATLHQDFNPPDEEQLNKIYKSLAQRVAGPNGESVLIISGGGKATAVKTSPADMDMIKSERFNVAMIAAAYGVPIELLSLDTLNYATAIKPMEKAWIKNTIVPLVMHFVRGINSFFYNKLDRELIIDVGQIPELMPTYEELEKVTFVTINEKRTMLGMPRLEDEMADRLLVPASLQLLEDLEREQEPETENI